SSSVHYAPVDHSVSLHVSPLLLFFHLSSALGDLPSFPTRRSSDLGDLPEILPGQSIVVTVQLEGVAPLVWVTEKLVIHPQSPQADRKSTRLNSSHVKISYAVFCLKKKKIS